MAQWLHCPILNVKDGALIHISSVEARRAIPLKAPILHQSMVSKDFWKPRVELKHEGILECDECDAFGHNTPYYNKVHQVRCEADGVPPYYEPSLVADAILYVAEHPTRDFIVGDVGTD